MKFARHVTIFRGQLDIAPFAGVFFLLVMFMMVASLVYTPGARLELQLPRANELPGTDKPSVAVAIDADGRLYYENQCYEEATLRQKLREEVRKTQGPLTLVVQVDKSVSYDKWLRLALLGREVGMADTLLATLPASAAAATHRPAP